jgi:hypothetical protein
MTIYKAREKGQYRIAYGRLVIGGILLAFLFGTLLLQQNAYGALSASAERAGYKRSKCNQKSEPSSLWAGAVSTKESFIETRPAPPVRLRRVGFFQEDPLPNLMECNGECPDDYLLCENRNTYIKGSGCCAQCCSRTNPNNCSDATCCEYPLIQ